MLKTFQITKPTTLVLFALLSAHAMAASPKKEVQACPVPVSQTSGRIASAPGRDNLGKGLTLLEQQRYASAYSSFKAALNEGLSDPLEKAQAFKNIALIMCQFKSAESCEQNLLSALYASSDFSLEKTDFLYTGVQQAFGNANKLFQSRCGNTPSLSSKAALVSTTSAAREKPRKATIDKNRFSMTQVSSDDSKSRKGESAMLYLQIRPWAYVTIDGGRAAVSPPVREIQVKPGTREISIKNSEDDPVFVEVDFKAGQTWVLQQNF